MSPRQTRGAATDAAAGSHAEGDRRRLLLLITLSSFLVPFMSSSLNVAMPAIGASFGASAVAVNWIVAAYLVSSAALMLPVGRVSDLLGRRAIFVAGTTAQGVISLACGLAPSAAALIALRLLQGAAASFGFATGMAILTSVFPRGERGRALGISTSAVYVGLSFGPVFGGAVTEHLGWRFIFFATAAVSIALGLGMLLAVRGEWRGEGKGRFDVISAVLYSGGAAAMMGSLAALNTLPAARWVLLAGLASIAAFLIRQAMILEPILNLAIFRNVVFALSNLAAFINYSSTFAVTFLLSLHLQVVCGLSPQNAGFVLLVQPVMMALLSPLAGRLSDRVEPRLVASAGMLLTVAGLAWLSALTPATPVVVIAVQLALLGTGFGLFSSPNSNAVMSAVDRRYYGVGSATLGTMRLTGQAASLAIVALLFAHFLGSAPISPAIAERLVASTRVSFLLFAGLAVPGLFASLARGRLHEAPGEEA